MIESRNMFPKDKKERRKLFVNDFKKKVYKICSNEYVLCNILIDICYLNNSSKQFVWDICGDVIIENLLIKNGHKINIPIIVDNQEDFIWNGKKYSVISIFFEEDEV